MMMNNNSNNALKITKDDNYCMKCRYYFIHNAQAIFTNLTFFTDLLTNSLERTHVINKLGIDLYPNITYLSVKSMPNESSNHKNDREIDLLPNINSIYTYSALHTYYNLNQNFGCSPFQIYNHIHGASLLNKKELIAQEYQNYIASYKSKPHCVTPFMFETYIMRNYTQCLQFFEIINSNEYKTMQSIHNILYIQKIGSYSHKGQGIDLIDQQQEMKLRFEYEEGRRCGYNPNNIIIQEYLRNPLLIYGHKFDLRMYMLIASTNPLVLYYHDGTLRISLYPYDTFSKEKAIHLTNTDISMKIREKGETKDTNTNHTSNQFNQTQIQDFRMWNLTQLQNYLLSKDKISSNTWLDTYFRPQIQKIMAHVGRFTSKQFLKSSNIYELFGIDFILDDNLKIWLIECNSGPTILSSSDQKQEFLIKMFIDHFEIVFGYLRSRVKRIIMFVNELIEEIGNDGEIYGLNQRKIYYAKINQNYFETEFEPSKNNSFVKVIDENLQGPERYNGFIPRDCYQQHFFGFKLIKQGKLMKRKNPGRFYANFIQFFAFYGTLLLLVNSILNMRKILQQLIHDYKNNRFFAQQCKLNIVSIVWFNSIYKFIYAFFHRIVSLFEQEFPD